MASQYDPTTFGWQNFYSAVLQSDITSGSLTLTLDTVPASAAGILVIEPDSTSNREVILYTSKGASTITCPADGRGWAGSTAVAHLTGSTLIMADVSSYFYGLSDGTLVSDAIRTAIFFDHIVSGGVVAISSGLVGTFSNIVFYLNGRRYSGTSIANKTYTASKDTYVDITGNSDGSITVLYSEVANNAASPALTTNYLRVAIVTTSGAAITNVNQGQTTMVLPLVSSVPASVSDTLGNLIYPRDPQRRVLGAGYRTTNAGPTATATGADIQVQARVIIPAGRRLKLTAKCGQISYSNSPKLGGLQIWDGVVGSGTKLDQSTTTISATSQNTGAICVAYVDPPSMSAATSKTYNVGIFSDSDGVTTVTATGATTSPITIIAELV